MSGYQEDCGEYAVTPILCMPAKCCENPPECFPCLPGCPKGRLMYCCEMKPEKGRKPRYEDDEYDRRDRTPPRRREHSPPRPSRRSSDKDSRPEPCCKPVKTKYVIPCYRYEDGRIVRQLPVSAFKRNGMQDQEHSKLLGTANFLQRCPRDVSVECDVCTRPVAVGDPARVPLCSADPLGAHFLRKKPLAVSLQDILDD